VVLETSNLQRVEDLTTRAWSTGDSKTNAFALALISGAVACALFASLLPLQVSIVTVFLFAGPHNWFELRYFLSRMPVRFGRSRTFFLTSFAGIGILTATYVSLPFIYRAGLWSSEAWSTMIASWNSLLLIWIAILVLLRSRQKANSDWSWFVPLSLAICAANWLQPDLFSLAIVYAHPLIALWFLDRHLKRTHPAWVPIYRRCLCVLPFLLAGMIWQLSTTAPLEDDNGLFWRITQHSGAQLLPQVSSHLLVSVHLFLELLHYAIWILVLPLLSSTLLSKKPEAFWRASSVPLARHPRGFRRLVACMLIVGLAVVVALWLGFSIDYATTRDIYFTAAIVHVLAEAPFLLRML